MSNLSSFLNWLGANPVAWLMGILMVILGAINLSFRLWALQRDRKKVRLMQDMVELQKLSKGTRPDERLARSVYDDPFK